MRSLGAATLVILMVAAACGGSKTVSPEGDTSQTTPNPSNNPSPSGNTATIQVYDNSFTPDSVALNAGGTATWKWSDNNYAAHNVTFTSGVTSGNKTSGEYSQTFTAAGTYRYNCTVHGPSMSGVVTVK